MRNPSSALVAWMTSFVSVSGSLSSSTYASFRTNQCHGEDLPGSVVPGQECAGRRRTERRTPPKRAPYPFRAGRNRPRPAGCPPRSTSTSTSTSCSPCSPRPSPPRSAPGCPATPPPLPKSSSAASRNPRPDHHHQRHHHHPARTPRLRTRSPQGQPARRYPHTLAGQPSHPLRVQLTLRRSGCVEIRANETTSSGQPPLLPGVRDIHQQASRPHGCTERLHHRGGLVAVPGQCRFRRDGSRHQRRGVGPLRR